MLPLARRHSVGYITFKTTCVGNMHGFIGFQLNLFLYSQNNLQVSYSQNRDHSAWETINRFSWTQETPFHKCMFWQSCISSRGGGERPALPEKLRGGMPPEFQSLDPIYEQNPRFSLPYYFMTLKGSLFKKKKHSQYKISSKTIRYSSDDQNGLNLYPVYYQND